MAKRLDPLPPSENDYWEHAEVTKIVLPNTPECKHYFIRTKGTQAECRSCRAGYFLTPEFQVKEGHIYKDQELVI